MQVQQIDNEQLCVQQGISSHRMRGTRRNTWRLRSRAQKLKDKRVAFPQSTLSKIVFISNSEGNGFRKQHFHLENPSPSLSSPSSKPVEIISQVQTMIDDINKACFNQWRDTLLTMNKQPLNKYDTLQSLLAACVFVVGAGLVGCIIVGLHQYMIKLAYAFMALIFIICLCSFLLMKEKRLEVNADGDMVRAIKRKLIQINQLEELNSHDNPRYIWTCHKDCLWIAIELK